MATQALVLIPTTQRGQLLPPHLFAPIVGLPYLQRLIFSLWRAGISRVGLLAPPAARAQLEKRLARMKGPAGATLEVFSRWQDLPLPAPSNTENGSILVMAADILTTPAVLAEFSRSPVPEGGLALAVADCRAGAQPPGIQAALRVSMEENLITSFDFATGSGSHCVLGLALFSQSAWRGWRSWLQNQGLAEVPDAAPNAALFPYFVEQARGNRLMGIETEAGAVASIQNDQDVKNAAFRLVMATHGSPWGEGCLESSVNRRLARYILLRLADKAILVHPNCITVADLLLGLVAVAGFLVGNYWAGLGAALLLPWIIVLDTLDGLLARLTFQESPEGRLLDLYGDTILNLLIFCGIAVGRYRATGQALFILLLIPLTFGYAWCWRLTNPLQERRRQTSGGLSPLSKKEFASGPEKMLNEAVSRDYFYLILLCALFNVLDWFIIATAIGINLFGLFLSRRRRPD